MACEGQADQHDAVLSTWFGIGEWPTCQCGFAPRDNKLLTAHWREHGFEIVDDHGHLVKRPIRPSAEPTHLTALSTE